MNRAVNSVMAAKAPADLLVVVVAENFPGSFTPFDGLRET